MAKKVLVVEDDDAARAGLIRLIAGRGHQVYAAATFEDGKRLLKIHHPDVLITDIRLGAFNGLQLLLSDNEHTQAIVATAFSDHVLEAEAKKLGAHFLLKPIVPAMLLDLIDELPDTPVKRAVAAPRPIRRWTRKPAPQGLAAKVNSSQATVLDVSYGGLRLGLGDNSSHSLPPSFEVVLPNGSLAVPVELVWQSQTELGSLECGVAVSSMNHETTRAWHGIVDAIV
ncbi:MAG TPA: response regulator [Vicinamibacterales bacterium]|jgi:CheY-like chemotaxis protein